MKRGGRFGVINLNKRRKVAKILAIFFVACIAIFLYMNYLVTPLIVRTAEAQVKVYANRAMNVAITEAMNQNITYDDLIHIVSDASGKISMIQANTIQINSLSKLIGRTTMKSLNENINSPILIPVGAFSGIPALSGLGPKISFNLQPYGDIGCTFESQFSQAGINQTHHKIYLNVNCNINLVLPFKSVVVSSKSDVLICESVIIGEIPETYLRSNTLTEMLNLVP
ncbi:MAG: sporulation protein YunB [Clostridia bacterium]|nr:sporulation protein YunB [Clostridia bacterium]